MEPVDGQPREGTGGGRMVLVMGLVGLIASVLLVGTYQLTEPRIAANRAAYLEASILEVLPGAVAKRTFVVDGNTLTPAPDDAAGRRRLFAGYDADGALMGIAIEAQGQGFQDILKIIYGYVPDCACIVGMKVLETKETPGLGDKIEKDPAFLANFDSLDARVASSGAALDNAITLVKKGEKTNRWEIEAITGATVSSRAIATIIGASAAEFVPLIEQNLPALRSEKSTETATAEVAP